MNDCRYKKGDWVVFMRNGKIKHGEVFYVGRGPLGVFNLHTTNGTVRDDSILESRSDANEANE